MGLVHQTKILVLQRNEFVYKPGDPVDALCLIRSGEIEFSQNKYSRKNPVSQNPCGSRTLNQSENCIDAEDREQQASRNCETGASAAASSSSSTSRRDEHIRFALLSTNGSFGSEDILLEKPSREHFARVNSNSAEIWIVDRVQFVLLLR